VKKALVIGCEGQDGSYLVEHLTGKGYSVTGFDRNKALGLPPGAEPIDIRNKPAVEQLVKSLAPDEIYYLAAFHQSSEDMPIDDDELIRQSFEINTLSLNHLLYAISTVSPRSRLFYAASSHIFGNPQTGTQDENTPLDPMDPYGISKTAGVHICRYYRRRRNVYSSVGILYNHESPRRSPSFVSRKVARAAARIREGSREKLVLGDLDAKVDWGYAPDYVDAMWRILQLEAPGDFVISSGVLHSVRDLVQAAFDAAGLDWSAHVEVDPGVARKQRGNPLQGNSALLESSTGWRPSKQFREIIWEMVQAETQQSVSETPEDRLSRRPKGLR
jgi:GDPmannose 4,6-dehydratase